MKSVCHPASRVLGGLLLTAVALTVAIAPAHAQNSESVALQSAPSALAPVALGVPSVLSSNVFAGQPQGAAQVDRKDPLVAGLLSWLLPGLGSFYAGNSGHGWRHLIIEGVVVTVYVVGAAKSTSVSCYGYSCDSPSYTLMWVGLGGMVVNSIWAIVTAASDASAHNAAGAPAGRQPGRVVGSLYVDPQIRVLGSQTAGPGTKTTLGLQVGRVAF